MEELGSLTRVELRKAWATEAQDFTPWLARDENLSQLGAVLGIDLELEAEEQEVGNFRADILCKNTDDDTWVVIENQLERTNHKHLGQLLTYAAGLEAVTVVWIAAPFQEEHRAALDWLNDITDERFQFFGLEVELWQIGDSLAAPKFNVVSKPNDWVRSVSKAKKKMESEALTETKALQLEYWTSFHDYLISQNSAIKPRKPLPRHWAIFTTGRKGFQLRATFSPKNRRISAGLNISADEAKSYFGLLQEQQTEIEKKLGFSLKWDPLPGKKSSRIYVRREDMDLTRKADWRTHHDWMREHLEALGAVFRPLIRELDADDWKEDHT